MRLCFHDDALIESVAAGKVLGPDDTVEAIRAAFREGVYSMNEWEIEPLGTDVVLAWAGVRHRPDGSKRISDTRIYWLVAGRDGLMWRVRIFHDRDTALGVLDEHGHDLGIEPTEPATDGRGPMHG